MEVKTCLHCGNLFTLPFSEEEWVEISYDEYIKVFRKGKSKSEKHFWENTKKLEEFAKCPKCKELMLVDWLTMIGVCTKCHKIFFCGGG